MAQDIVVRLPEQLSAQLKRLVQDGWFADSNDLILEAVRRFVDSHSPDLMEELVNEDLHWGLHGED